MSYAETINTKVFPGLHEAINEFARVYLYTDNSWGETSWGVSHAQHETYLKEAENIKNAIVKFFDLQIQAHSDFYCDDNCNRIFKLSKSEINLA